MQPTLEQWLNRKPKGKAPPRPLKRCRVKKVSKRRAKEGRIYSQRRKVFLAANPHCEAWHVISQWMYNQAPEDYVKAPQLCPRSEDVHHRERRGKNYLNEETWMAVSRWAHEWIHSHPKEARALNLLQ